MSYLSLLPKVTVKIAYKSQHIGSGVLIKNDNQFYVISAAHVVYGEEFELLNTLDLKDLTLESEEYGVFSINGLVGEKDDHKDLDLIPIKVTLEKKYIDDYPEVGICDDVNFPGEEFIFRGTAKSISGGTYSISPCFIDTLPDETNQFCLKVPQESYSSSKGESGAEVLQGYSGSGIFSKNADKFLLVGIVLSVSDDNFNGVNCLSITVLKDKYFPSLLFEDFHGGNNVVKLGIADFRKKITAELITKRKQDQYGDVENLSRKMDVFIGNWQPEDLDQFLSDILIWEMIEHDKVRNSDEYTALIDEAKALLASGNKKYRVDGVDKGNDYFHSIQEKFDGLLTDLLKETPLKGKASAIASGEIARMLADCTLDFRLSDEN